MPTFAMLFNGLILHLAEGGNAKTAVLIDDPGHIPKLVIPNNTLVRENGWVGTVNGLDREYDLRGCKVRLDAIDTSAMTVDPSFTNGVPSLRDILEEVDDLKDEVTRKDITADVATAYVTYSGGTLSVVECFEIEVVFDPAVSGDPRCIGRTIRFLGSTTAGSDITIHDGKGNSITILDGTEIRIRNTSGGGAHHQEYRRLTKNGKGPRPMVPTIRNCATCTPTASTFVDLTQEGKTERVLETLPELSEAFSPFIGDLRGMFVVPVRKSVSIECSNSQWP